MFPSEALTVNNFDIPWVSNCTPKLGLLVVSYSAAFGSTLMTPQSSLRGDSDLSEESEEENGQI